MSDKLGYQDNTAGPGKDGYNPKASDSKDNYHQKPKARQDGVNQKSNCDATEAEWGLPESEGKGKTK